MQQTVHDGDNMTWVRYFAQLAWYTFIFNVDVYTSFF